MCQGLLRSGKVTRSKMCYCSNGL